MAGPSCPLTQNGCLVHHGPARLPPGPAAGRRRQPPGTGRCTPRARLLADDYSLLDAGRCTGSTCCHRLLIDLIRADPIRRRLLLLLRRR